MKSIFHAMFGSLVLALIFLFFTSSLVADFWYTQDVISSVKSLILQGFFWLIPMLVITGFLGLSLAKFRQGRMIESKKKRMLWILLICIVILLPAAYRLNSSAQRGEFDIVYSVVQSIEYLFDLITLTLLGLNFRDGVKLVSRESMSPNDREINS
ncbi:MAG: hypothetical protein V4536_08020 [Pseudomonadota bacterium]